MSALTVNELKARFEAGDRPSAKDFSDFIDSIQAWIADTLNPVNPGIALLYSSTVTLSTATYDVSYTPPVTSFSDGTVLAFKADAINPASGTNFNPDGLGAKPIHRERGVVLKAGDILTHQIVEIRYEAVADAWVMMSPTSHPGLRSGDIVTSGFPLEEDGTRFLCNGQSVDTNIYPTLAALGTIYGTPSPNDGHHVKLPDYAGRFPLGAGTAGGGDTLPIGSPAALGDLGGEELHTLTAVEVAKHRHWVSNTDSTVADPDTPTMANNNQIVKRAGLGTGFNSEYALTATSTDATVGRTSEHISGTTLVGDQPHNNMPPWIAAYYYILT